MYIKYTSGPMRLWWCQMWLSSNIIMLSYLYCLTPLVCTLWLYFQEFHQHDAQELNRILFSAIEDSLIGTPGQTLIRELYHGTIVNQVAWLYSILLIIAYFLLRFSAGLSRFFMFFWSTCEKKRECPSTHMDDHG